MIKRIITCFLVVAMLAGLSLPVMAEGTEELTGRYDSFEYISKALDSKTLPTGVWTLQNIRGDSNYDTFTEFNSVFAAANGSAIFALAKGDDGKYDFATTASSTIALANSTSSTAIDTVKSRALMSKYWMRTNATNVSTSKKYLPEHSSVAKIFTAPQTGTVTITAYDANGENKIWGKKISEATKAGASVRIIKIGANDKAPAYSTFSIDDNCIWNDKITFTNPEKSTEAALINFTPIKVDVTAGEKIYFIANAGDTEAANAKFVHWNPVVTYAVDSEVSPDVENTEVAPDREFEVRINEENIGAITESNITISPSDNGEVINSFSQVGNVLKFSFNKLQSETDYNVFIDGIMVDDTCYCTEFDFTTEYFYTYPVYDSNAAWPETTFSEMKNENSVWKWLYRNVTDTESVLNDYKYYEEVGQNGTDGEFSKPKLVINEEAGNEKYDYSQKSSEATTFVFADSTSSPGRRNAMGKYWMRLSTGESAPFKHTYNRIVKEFIAPDSGNITITAKDLNNDPYIYNKNTSQGTAHGAVVKVVRENDRENVLWQYEFKNVEAKKVVNCKFEPLEISVTAGEKIWFEVSGELVANGWSQMVSWNPVVTYTHIAPNLIDIQPTKDNNTDISLNFEHKMTFNYAVRPISKYDITIDNGASVNSLEFDNSDKTIIFTFDGLKAYTKYNVTVNNLVIADVPDGDPTSYEYTFTTGSAIQIDSDVYLESGSLKAGENVVCVDVNNASNESYSAVLLAAVCKGKPDNYEIVETKYNNSTIGENDTIKLSVSIDSTAGYFIKAVLLKDLSSAVALCDMKIITAN